MKACKPGRFVRAVRIAMLLSLFACPLYAQTGSLAGKVTDLETGEPLPGANVVVLAAGASGPPTGGAAGVNGEYDVRGLQPGTYMVTATFIGYSKKEIRNVEIRAGETRTLNIQLEQSAINVDAISITASRRPEKVLEAPAAVEILESQQIEARSTLSPVDHLKGMPAVDIVQTGLTQSNVVVRGFNNIFSGALLTLVDNRISRVPSLRFNAHNFIPTINEDIERMEVVFGPGSALYGPNSASGVLHIITKSPFGSEGTEVSVAGGVRSNERDEVLAQAHPNFVEPGFYKKNGLYMASFRHASSFNNKFGFKVSGQYYQGYDWISFEPELEPRRIILNRQTPQGPVIVGKDSINNVRDFNIEKLSGEARMDWRFSDRGSLILNGGFNRSSNIDLTGIGAGQAINWTYSFAQARFNFDRLFIQGFMNRSDAGDTYILNTGSLIVDRSKLWVGQIQHSADLNDGQHRFTYGADVLLTRPNTDNTINGRNEDDDDINEIGGYLQVESDLTQQLTGVIAARLDNSNQLDDPVFSPRAALVFKPTPTNNFRITYNRAFSTPTANNLFLDIASVLDVYGLGRIFGSPAFGTDVRAQGVPETGFNFRVDDNGPMFRSPFAPLGGRDRAEFFSLHDPFFTNVMWGAANPLVTAGLEAQFRPALVAQGLPAPVIDQIFADFRATILPRQIAGVRNNVAQLNLDTRNFDPITGALVDIPRIRPTITQTVEAGYKGVLGEKLVLGANAYFASIKDFVGPLSLETPNVFLDQNTLFASLLPQFQANFDASTNFLMRGVLQQLDLPANGGNGNGTPADELAGLYASNASGIPLGTVGPQEALDPTAMILTYRNFDDNLNYWGADLNFTYFINRNWNFSGNYAYVSKDVFPKNEKRPSDVYLNAPMNKAGATIQYDNRSFGFSAQLRYRYVDAFPMSSGPWAGIVPDYHIFDLNLMATDINARKTRIMLTITNLFDNKHQQFLGAPEIGRLMLMRVSQRL